MNKRGELEHKEAEEVRRTLQETKAGLRGRETFDLDFCWGSPGKTGTTVSEIREVIVEKSLKES